MSPTPTHEIPSLMADRIFFSEIVVDNFLLFKIEDSAEVLPIDPPAPTKSVSRLPLVAACLPITCMSNLGKEVEACSKNSLNYLNEQIYLKQNFQEPKLNFSQKSIKFLLTTPIE